MFFVYAVNHILYAERHGLTPWVHFLPTNPHVYDDAAHGAPSRTVLVESWRKTRRDGRGAPIGPADTGAPKTVEVAGSGVWDSYFEPVGRVDASTPCLTRIPRLALFPGLHYVSAPGWAPNRVAPTPRPVRLAIAFPRTIYAVAAPTPRPLRLAIAFPRTIYAVAAAAMRPMPHGRGRGDATASLADRFGSHTDQPLGRPRVALPGHGPGRQGVVRAAAPRRARRRAALFPAAAARARGGGEGPARRRHVARRPLPRPG